MVGVEDGLAADNCTIARLEALDTRLQERKVAYLELESAIRKQIVLDNEKLVESVEAETVEYAETASQQEIYVDERLDEPREELVQLLDQRLNAFGMDVVERYEVEDLIEEKACATVEDLKKSLAGGRSGW